MVTLTRVGEFVLTWGESLRWDDGGGVFYLVDWGRRPVAPGSGAAPPLNSMGAPAMPALGFSAHGWQVGWLDAWPPGCT